MLAGMRSWAYWHHQSVQGEHDVIARSRRSFFGRCRSTAQDARHTLLRFERRMSRSSQVRHSEYIATAVSSRSSSAVAVERLHRW